MMDADAVPHVTGEVAAELGGEAKLPISSAIWALSSREHMLMLISPCARSTACAWVKCTR